MSKKNKFFTLVFSCYPGGGHMYLGFMKQGFQLMVLFSLVLVISSMSYSLRGLGFLLPILVAYSIFDSSNKRSSMTPPDDSNLELFNWINIGDYPKLKDVNHYKLGAYVLVILGAYMLFENFALDLFRSLTREWFGRMNINFSHIERAIKSSILGIIFIIGGVKLLAKTKKMDIGEKDEDHV